MTHFSDLLKIKNSESERFRRYQYLYGKVFDELLNVYSNWQERVVNLLDYKGYDFTKLQDRGGFRKPKAYFSVSLTSRGNFALDWYPREYIDGYYEDKGDWIWWENTREMGGEWLPYNRILFIRDMRKIFSSGSGPVESTALLTLGQLLETIYSFLGNFVEVIIIDDLHVNHPLGSYDGEYPTGVTAEFRRVLPDVGKAHRMEVIFARLRGETLDGKEE